jgi:predicted RNA-binding Zn ribbon-like protein
MFLRSFFYERDVLTHLERVRTLPAEVQAEIAMRVGNFIELARFADNDLMQRFAQVARAEQQRAVEVGVKSDIDPLRAAPAISEAWCNAKLGLATGSLNQHSAIEIIIGIETFTAKKASDHQRKV